MNDLVANNTTRQLDKILSSDDRRLFHTLDDRALETIAERMPEVYRANRIHGKKNTQTQGILMTLTMLADTSPYRVLRQCLAQIENKRIAVKDNMFRMERKKIFLEKAKVQKPKDGFDKELLALKVAKLKSDIEDQAIYLEGALKQLAMYQDVYLQVCRNNNIPEKWDEQDMEDMEVRFHLRMAFLHAYRDIMNNGRLGLGTLEYLQQFGVHPHTAFRLTMSYVDDRAKKADEGGEADYEDLENWLDVMVERYKDQYKKVLKRLGIESLTVDWTLYRE